MNQNKARQVGLVASVTSIITWFVTIFTVFVFWVTITDRSFSKDVSNIVIAYSPFFYICLILTAVAGIVLGFCSLSPAIRESIVVGNMLLICNMFGFICLLSFTIMLGFPLDAFFLVTYVIMAAFIAAISTLVMHINRTTNQRRERKERLEAEQNQQYLDELKRYEMYLQSLMHYQK